MNNNTPAVPVVRDTGSRPDSNEGTAMNRPARFQRLPSAHGAAVGNNPRFMKRLIVGLATTAAVSGGLGLTGLGLAGTAQADYGPHQWCPGQSVNYLNGKGPAFELSPGEWIVWDMHVCHTWYDTGNYRTGNVLNYMGDPTSIWDGPNPPPPAPPPAPPPLWVP